LIVMIVEDDRCSWWINAKLEKDFWMVFAEKYMHMLTCQLWLNFVTSVRINDGNACSFTYISIEIITLRSIVTEIEILHEILMYW